MSEIGHFVCPDVTKPLDLYTHATTFQGLVYVSGVQGFTPGTFAFPSDEPREQTRQVMKNLQAILLMAGSDLPYVVKSLSDTTQHLSQLTLFLKHMPDFPEVNAAVNEAFPTNPPARSTVQVSDLPRNARVVAEVIAAQKSAVNKL